MTTLTVGQVLWYVPPHEGGAWGRSCAVTVTKIGTVWAKTNAGFRIRIETLTPYLSSSRIQGSLYLNEETALNVAARRKAWLDFKYAISWVHDLPSHMSIGEIEALSSSLTGQVKT